MLCSCGKVSVFSGGLCIWRWVEWLIGIAGFLELCDWVSGMEGERDR